MKTRKIMTAALALALTFSMGTTVSAGEITVPGAQGASADIKATYQTGGETVTPVYCVDVTWGSLEFVYHGSKALIWNPDTLKYEEKENAAEPGWEPADLDAGTIKVKNHSNVPVMANLSYEKGTGYDGIAGIFNQDSFILASAEGTTAEGAPSADAILTLDGALSENVTENVTIGTAKVTINEMPTIPVYTRPTSSDPFMTLYQQDANTYIGTAKPNLQGTAFTFVFDLGGYKYYSYRSTGQSLGTAIDIGSSTIPDQSGGNISFTPVLDSNTEYQLTFKIQGRNATVTVTEAE